MPGRAYFWAELKSDDFRALDPETTIAILPVAATEQHGPHLPVMTDTAIAEGMIGLLKDRLPPRVERLGAADPGHRQVERTPVVAGHAEPVGRNPPARACRDGQGSPPRRFAQIGSGEFSWRQRIGAGDRCARAAGRARDAGRLDALALVRAAERHVRRRGSASRHPRRRHRDLADAVVSPRSREHGQGEEFCLVRHRHGEGIHPSWPDRHAMPSAGSRKTSTPKAPSATPARPRPKRAKKPPNTRSTVSSRCCAT